MKIPSLILLAKTNKKEVVANRLVCRDTKKAVYSNIVKEAISPFSGESFLKALDKSVTLDEQTLASLKDAGACPACDTVLVASEKFLESNPKFHCVICNEEMKAPIIEEDVIVINDNPAEVQDSVVEESKECMSEEEIVIVDDLPEAPAAEEPKEEEKVVECAEEIKEVEAKEASEEEVKEEIEEPKAEEVAPEALEEVKEEIKDAVKEEIKEEIKEELKEEITTPAGEEKVVIEINSPESVVVAPEELKAEELPEELHEVLEGVNEQGFDIPESIYTADLTYNLAHLLTKADYQDKIELVASSINEEAPVYYLMVNSIPVAVAEFSNASEAVKAMFSDKDLVMKSLQVTLANCEAAETNLRLKDFGVRAITTPVISEKAAVASNLVKAARALEENYKKKEAEMFNVWRESFSTAALMYCKNLQKKSSLGKTKSLITKASITETLRSVGIQNADLIVEEAFKRGIQRDYAVIVEEALSLYTKTPEARKEVRDFVADADYSASASLDSDEAKSVEHSAHESVSSVVEDSEVDVASLIGAIRRGNI